MVGDGPVSLPAHAVQMQGVRAYDGFYLSRDEERRRERMKEREREREREARRQKEAAPKQVKRRIVCSLPGPVLLMPAAASDCSGFCLTMIG